MLAPTRRITVERSQRQNTVHWRVVRWSKDTEWTTCGMYRTQIDANSVRDALVEAECTVR
jgi:hypothetical protein